MIGGYSDIFLISSNTIKEFCHYCGVFAATKLFVEIALPTSIVLTAQEIITEKDIDFAGKALWPDGWVRMGGNFERAYNDFDEIEKFNYNLKDLLTNFPKNYLYIHPVKLSKWNTNL